MKWLRRMAWGLTLAVVVGLALFAARPEPWVEWLIARNAGTLGVDLDSFAVRHVDPGRLEIVDLRIGDASAASIREVVFEYGPRSLFASYVDRVSLSGASFPAEFRNGRLRVPALEPLLAGDGEGLSIGELRMSDVIIDVVGDLGAHRFVGEARTRFAEGVLADSSFRMRGLEAEGAHWFSAVGEIDASGFAGDFEVQRVPSSVAAALDLPSAAADHDFSGTLRVPRSVLEGGASDLRGQGAVRVARREGADGEGPSLRGDFDVRLDARELWVDSKGFEVRRSAETLQAKDFAAHATWEAARVDSADVDLRGEFVWSRESEAPLHVRVDGPLRLTRSDVAFEVRLREATTLEVLDLGTWASPVALDMREALQVRLNPTERPLAVFGRNGGGGGPSELRIDASAERLELWDASRGRLAARGVDLASWLRLEEGAVGAGEVRVRFDQLSAADPRRAPLLDPTPVSTRVELAGTDRKITASLGAEASPFSIFVFEGAPGVETWSWSAWTRDARDLVAAVPRLRGYADRATGVLTGRGRLRVSDGDGPAWITSPGLALVIGDVSVRGLAGTLALRSLRRFATRGVQVLSFTSLDAGVPLANGAVWFERAANGRIQLEPFRAWGLGGLFEARGGIEPHGAGALELSLRALDLEAVGPLLSEDLDLAGKADSGLDVAWDTESVRFENGFARSKGGGGLLRYDGAGLDALRASEQATQRDVVDALRDFRFDSLELGFEGDLDAGIEGSVRLLGHSPRVLEGRDIDLTLNVDSRFPDLRRTHEIWRLMYHALSREPNPLAPDSR